MQPNTPLTYKRAVAWLLALWVFVLCVGHIQAVIGGYESVDARLLPSMGASVIFSYLLLPCGFLHFVFGYTDAEMPKDWIHEFIFGYCAAVMGLQGLFVWLRRWWMFCAAAVLLVMGAAGCSSWWSTVRIKL